jgi:acyl-CoA thioester hydrolase
VSVRGRVEWMDTDAAGIHHRAAIARFAETAESQLMDQLGLDEYFSQAPRVRYEVSFESPLFFQQEVTTVLGIESVGTSSLTLFFEVWGEPFKGQPRRRAAAGRYVTAHVPGGVKRPGSTEERVRSTPWPDGWFSPASSVR